MLQYFGVIPYIVFDGDYLPSKAGTETARAARREESKKLGLELYRTGKVSQAQQELQKAVDVTPAMARRFIDELKRLGVQYVVAPFEADAQLAYLERKGIINGILSEDSDLLVFGAKRLLTKLDQHGDCIEINRSNFTSCREVSLVGWTDTDFRRMAIFSGCDYLSNINKMGLKTAYRYVRKYKTAEKVVRMLEFDGSFHVPQGYLDKFGEAERTFLHHRVFCPVAKKLVFLTELGPDTKEEDMPYIGAGYEDDLAIGVACGDLDPMTKLPIVSPRPNNFGAQVRPGPERRQTLGTPSDLKAKKPIDSFFTPRRTPLAELDPNSMTPSPGQQRLLERHAGASWQASPAPATGPTTMLSSTSTNGVRRVRHSTGSNLDPATTDRTSFLSRASTMSTFQPVKRQRLCSEADEILEKVTSACETSSFFPPKNDTGSAKKEGSRRKSSNFGIFSDDNVQAALDELPDGTEGVKPRKIGVFKEEAEEVGVEEQSKTQTSQSESLNSSVSSQASSRHIRSFSRSTSLATSQTSQTSASIISTTDGDESFDAAVEQHVKMQNSLLRQRFSYQGSQASPSSQRGSTADLELAANASVPSLLKRNVPVSSSITPTRPKTTLERLGVAALQRSKSMDAFTFRAPAGSPRLRPSRRRSSLVMHSESVADDNDEAESKMETENKIVAETGPAAETLVTGSEDMIVPNSEDEAEEIPSSPARPRASLNLGKFVFAPA